MKKSVVLAVALVLSALMVFSASAVPLSGSRTTPAAGGGIAGFNGYASADDGFRLDWSISFDEMSGIYHYQYSFFDEDGTTLSKPGLGHWILEVSPTFTLDDISNVTIDGVAYNGMELKTWKPGENGNSNLGLPGDLYGIKFDKGGSVYAFDSARAPIWGDFYAKGGQSYAYNNGFGIDPADVQNPCSLCWIATPDTEEGGPPSNVIPEPASAILVGLGLVGLLGRKRLARK